MSLWSNIKAQIYKRNGILVGEIAPLTKINGLNELDVIGNGSIEIPLNYTPAHDLVKKNRVCVVIANEGLANEVIVTQFLIKDIKKVPKGKAGTLVVSGDDLTSELMFETLGYNVISDGNDGPSTQPIRELLDLYEANSIIGWSIAAWGGGSSKAYLVGSGETIWDALLQVTQANGGHINLANRRPYVGQTGPLPFYQLQFWWDHQQDGTSFTHWFGELILEQDPPNGYPNRRPIKGIQKREKTAGIVTRCYISGAGLGEDMFTFEDATDTPPAGFTFYPSTGLLINDTLEADPEQPRITRVVQFGNIKPEDPENATQRQTAANAGLAAGVQFLQENDGSTTTYYEVDTTVLAPHTPGQLVTLIWNHESNIDSSGQVNPTNIIDVNGQFVLIRYELEMGPDNVLQARLLLGETPRPRKSGAKTVVKRMKDLETTVRHAKAGASSSTPGGGTPPAGGDYLKTTNSPALAGDLPVNAGVRIDSTDISELKLSDFLLMASSSEAIRGRVIQATNGLQLVDGGAGATAVLSLLLDTLAGLQISGNKLKMGTPGDLSVSSANGVTATSHTHEIKSSSDPGAAAWILATDNTGRIKIRRLEVDKFVMTDRATDQEYNLFLENGRLYIETI